MSLEFSQIFLIVEQSKLLKASGNWNDLWTFKVAKLFTVVPAKTVYIILHCHTDFDPQIIYFQKRKELSADKVNLRNMRWDHPGFRVHPKTQWLPSLWEKEGGSLRQENRRMPCRDGSKDWSDAAASQGMPGATGSWKRQGRLLCSSLWKDYFLPQLWFLWFSDSKTERRNFCCFKPPSFWSYVEAALWNECILHNTNFKDLNCREFALTRHVYTDCSYFSNIVNNLVKIWLSKCDRW